jgi:hypothetical protein
MNDPDEQRDFAAEERRSNEYDRHPLAKRYGRTPLHERSAEFAALRADIKASGLLVSILLYRRDPSEEWMVLDGWDRYRAGLAADADMKFERLEGEPLKALRRMTSLNYRRRRDNFYQRLRMAAIVVNSTWGGDRSGSGRPGDKRTNNQAAACRLAENQNDGDDLGLPEITVAMAAEMYGVGERRLRDAVKQIATMRAAKEVWPQIDKALEHGKLSFDDGFALAGLPVDQQLATVQSPEWVYGKLRPGQLAKEFLPKRHGPPALARVGRSFLNLDESDQLRHLTFAFEQASEAVKAQFMAATGAPWLNEHEYREGA